MDKLLKEILELYLKTPEGRQVILIIVGLICCVYQLIFYRKKIHNLRVIIERFFILLLLGIVSIPIIYVYEGGFVGWFFNTIAFLKLLYLLLEAIRYSNHWSGSDGYLYKLIVYYKGTIEDIYKNKLRNKSNDDNFDNFGNE